MDRFQPHASDVQAGHESGDFSERGIILFIVLLVLFAIVTFFAAWGLMGFFEWAEVKYFDKPSTAAQQQLSEQRGEMATREGVRPTPDWYNREIDEKVLEKTFAAPRLQYDDAADMGLFVHSEKDWLENTGHNPDGSVHIPIDRALDLLSSQGLPPVNGSFTPQPPLGALEAVSDAAKLRVQEAGGAVQSQTKQKKK